MGKICSAFGHREMYVDCKDKLEMLLNELICQNEVEIFYTGSMGDFDLLFSSCVRGFKHLYPKLKLVLVKPYFTKEINLNKEYYESLYDDILIPEISSNAHYKSAITLRNKWIVDKSDFIISGVYKNYGGAYNAIKYANSVNKSVLNIF